MDKIEVRKNGRKRVKVMFHDKDGKALDKILTKQSFVEECDINTIVNRHKKSGTLPLLPDPNHRYGDFSNIGTFQDVQMKLFEAEDLFMAQSAKIRSMFDNDYVKYIEFIDNPENREEAIKLGLFARETASEAQSTVAEEVKKEAEAVSEQSST